MRATSSPGDGWSSRATASKKRGVPKVGTTPSIAIVNGLARLVQRGDVRAKHDLYQLFKPLLQKIIAPFRRSAELYQDLHAEVYLIFDRLVLKWDESRGIDLPAYLSTVLPQAVETCVCRHRRKAGREIAWSSLATITDPDAWTEAVEESLQRLGSTELCWMSRANDPAAQGIERLSLQQAIQSLPPRQREVFTLREVEGYSSRDIAAQLDLDVTTVRRHFQNARTNLRKILQKISEGE